MTEAGWVMTGSSHRPNGLARQPKDVAGHPPRLLDEVRARVRRLGLARRTEEAYAGWIRRFILASGKRHPREMGGREVGAFLTSLANSKSVAHTATGSRQE